MLQIQALGGIILIFSPAGRASEKKKKVFTYNPQQTLEVLPSAEVYMDSIHTKTSRLVRLKKISALQKQFLPNEPDRNLSYAPNEKANPDRKVHTQK